MKVAYMQYDVAYADVEKNLKTVETMCEQLDADLLVLPELAFSGYSFVDASLLYPLASKSTNDLIARRMGSLAKKKSMGIIYGTAIYENHHYYNAAVALDESGVVHTHRKITLTDNEKVFARGGEAAVFSIKGVNVGIMICFDAWFAPLATHLREQGAQLFVVPANFGGPWTHDVARVRALENTRPVVLVNRTGSEIIASKRETFCGGSRMIDAYGNVLVVSGQTPNVQVREITIPEKTAFKSLLSSTMLDEHNAVKHVIMKTNNKKS